MVHAYKLKLPNYKSRNDIEIFVNRYEQLFENQNIDSFKRTLIVSALNDVTFAVVLVELSENEGKSYERKRKHFLERFDILNEKGQRRLQLKLVTHMQ